MVVGNPNSAYAPRQEEMVRPYCRDSGSMVHWVYVLFPCTVEAVHRDSCFGTGGRYDHCAGSAKYLLLRRVRESINASEMVLIDLLLPQLRA